MEVTQRLQGRNRVPLTENENAIMDDKTSQRKKLPKREKSIFLEFALWKAFIFVFTGCCINNFALEKLIRADPGIGNLVTVLQFVFITSMGLLEHVDWSRLSSGSMLKKRSAPLSFYLKTTLIFLLVSVINNIVFLFNISLPFHMIFRSCSLVVNMLLGLIFFKKVYTRQQMVSCALITLGVIAATMADSMSKLSAHASSDCCDDSIPTAPHVDVPEDATYTGLFPWMIGVSLLVVSLLLSALLGHIQEWGYRHFGRHAEENMFYSHAMSLPFFVFLLPDIWNHMKILASLPPVHTLSIGGSEFNLPYFIVLVVNLASQYVCVRAVYNITCLSTSLTCTFAITVRKFVSLIFSVLYFRNPFTYFHWFGTIFVFGGTVLYATSPGNEPPPTIEEEQQKKEN